MDFWQGNIDYKGSTIQRFLLMSDWHFEAYDCQKGLIKDDLDTAARVGARVSINGDLTDLILPSDLKRYQRALDTTDRADAINAIVEELFEFCRPYADLFDVISYGNHETEFLKRHQQSVLNSLATLLKTVRDPKLPPIHVGDYKGFMRYKFYYGDARAANATFDIFRFHGGGGNAPVSKGMIDINRALINHRADLYWFGHKHTAIQDNDIPEIGISMRGKPYKKRRRAVFTAGYKGAFMPDLKNASPYSDRFVTQQAQSCAWLTLKLQTDGASRVGTSNSNIVKWIITDDLIDIA